MIPEDQKSYNLFLLQSINKAAVLQMLKKLKKN